MENKKCLKPPPTSRYSCSKTQDSKNKTLGWCSRLQESDVQRAWRSQPIPKIMRANEGSRKSTVYSHVAVSSLIGLFEATRPFSGAFIHIIYDWLHIYIYIPEKGGDESQPPDKWGEHYRNRTFSKQEFEGTSAVVRLTCLRACRS